MAKLIPYEFAVDTSEQGTSTPACVDVVEPRSGEITIVREVTAFIRTRNGKSKIAAKNLEFDRYAHGVTDRDVTAPEITSWVPISSTNAKEVDYHRTNGRYSSVVGLPVLSGTGLRVEFNNKDRNSDTQYLSIGTETLNADHLA